MAPVFQHVSLSEIALDDHTFIVTYRPEMQALQRSVARVGVLTPLHLRCPTLHAPLQVVCGSKRLQACQLTGHATVPALVHTANELPALQALLLAVHDNLGCRSLNSIEKARILYRLREQFGYTTATLSEEFCPLFDLPPRADTVEAYCLLATMEDALQAATVAGALPIETAVWIGAHLPDDRHALLALFTGLHLGSNRAREFATWIDELCQRDACQVAELFQRLDIPILLADLQRPGPQKVEAIRRRLRQARYPQLSTHEQRFQEACRRLRLPPQITLRPPPYFEGAHYQITFAFSQRQELHHYAQRLLDAAATGTLDELLDLL